MVWYNLNMVRNGSAAAKGSEVKKIEAGDLVRMRIPEWENTQLGIVIGPAWEDSRFSHPALQIWWGDDDFSEEYEYNLEYVSETG